MFKYFRDLLLLLRSIDKRLEQLEKCIAIIPIESTNGGRGAIRVRGQFE